MRNTTDVPESERLIQQFLDQELSGEDRLKLLLQIGCDRALRERVIDLERLSLEVARLPRPRVSDDFVGRVMERVAPPRPAWRRALDPLWAPRSLRWNLASAVAAAAALVVVTAGLASWRSTDPRGSTMTATTTSSSPSTVLVRLVVLQPDAMSVELAGDFNGWDPRRTPLEPMAGGAWSVTISVPPGRYEYMFVVNGREWVGDPLAEEQNDDGFGSQNAVLDVLPQAGAEL